MDGQITRETKSDRRAKVERQPDAAIASTVERMSAQPNPTPSGPSNTMTGEWTEVDLEFLSPAQTSSPEFPIELLPDALRAIIAGFCDARQLSADYVGMSILTACSGAIGNRARILTLEGEAEPLVVHTTLVGHPSTGKSISIAIVEKPLHLIEERIQAAYASATGSHRAPSAGSVERRIQDIVMRRLELEGLSGLDVDTGAALRDVPAIVLSETTGAGLIAELRDGCDGRILVSHELTGALAFGAAHQGLRSRGLLLEGYDGKRRTVRTKTEGRVVIAALWVAVLGATQPSRLKYLLGDADDGLAARTWWIYPNVMSRTKISTSPGPVDDLEAMLTRLVAIRPAGKFGSSYSALTAQAPGTRGAVETYCERWEKLVVLTDGLYRDFVGRAPQHALRLSGIFAIAEHAASGRDGLPDRIGIDMMDRALQFVDRYLLAMAERTLSAAQVPQEGDAARLARFLARAGKPLVNIRADIHRAAGSPLREHEAVAVALEELRQRNVVRPVARVDGRLGRPTSSVHIHPALLSWANKSTL